MCWSEEKDGRNVSTESIDQYRILDHEVLESLLIFIVFEEKWRKMEKMGEGIRLILVERENAKNTNAATD
jgi:hypothetical protein